jgi:hypothetical protein
MNSSMEVNMAAKIPTTNKEVIFSKPCGCERVRYVNHADLYAIEWWFCQPHLMIQLYGDMKDIYWDGGY